MSRPWRWGGLALGVMVLAVGIPSGLRHVSFFNVRRIELAGARYLSAREVAQVAHLGPNANLFDSWTRVRDRIRALPGVLEANVARRLPGTLRITVREAQPVALAPKGERLVPIDPQGHPLPFDPTRAPPDLPILSAPDAKLSALLARVRDTEPALFARIQSVSRTRDDVILETSTARLWLRTDASVDAIRALEAVSEELARLGRSYRELDGRFAGRVFVRGARA